MTGFCALASCQNLDPEASAYLHQFEHCRNDQFQHDSFSANQKSQKEHSVLMASSSSTGPQYMPYDKGTPRFPNSFHPTLCVQCGSTGHKAAACHATTSNVTTRPIIIDWKTDRLVLKAGKFFCLMFNVKGVCFSSSNPPHGAHCCSLCGDTHHAACACTQS